MVLEPTTFAGDGNRDLDFGGKSITIRSKAPDIPWVVAATVINCEGSRAEPHRGFIFESGESNDSILDGITITGGYGDQQAGYYAGGAIFCNNSSPTIKRCVITNNVTDAVKTNVDGGGIACYSNANPEIINCTITNNSAQYSGGISCWNSSPTIKSCLIADNQAEFAGGIYFFDFADANVANCTISNNAGNVQGGGLTSYNSSPTMTNTLLWGNASGQGNPQSLLEDVNSSPSFTHCNIEGSDIGGLWNADLGVDGGNNIDANPLFEDVSQGDYHISSGSPCINAGDPLYTATGGETDMDGDARIRDGVIEIGVDEMPLCIAADVNCDGQVTGADLAIVNHPDNWFKTCEEAANPRADVTGDGQVTGPDLAAINHPDVWFTGTGSCSCPDTTCP